MFFPIFFAFMALFWAFAAFRGARWTANDEGPSVWSYAQVEIAMCAACLALAAVTWWVS